MRKTSFALALLTAAVLAACGGSGGIAGHPSAGDQTPTIKFSAEVSFGDSLSDVGSYGVGAVKQLGGGKFTINGNNTAVNPELTGRNWTEVMAAQLGVAAPCPAQTGLEGSAPGFTVPSAFFASCTNYAMGGARVSNPIGAHNKANDPALGALTVPMATQVANHLAKNGGKFSGAELVTVLGGGGDILTLLSDLSTKATATGSQTFATSLATQLAAGARTPATAVQQIGLAIQTESVRTGHTDASIVAAAVGAAVAAGNTAAASPTVYGPMVTKAQVDATAAGTAYAAANGPAIVTAMAAAGAELAALVKTQIVGKGANYVILANLPDVASAPSSKAKDANTQALINAAVDAFNNQLKASIAGEAKILYVDLWSISHDQVINPAPYGLTNTSSPACATNALNGSSLACNASNLVAGDVSHYMFADDVHPTPFENALIARYVLEQMAVKGWL
jgi:phospholipase/lecithinase/hemolysin